MKQFLLILICGLTLSIISCSKSNSPDLVDLAAKVEGTYEGSLDTGTTDYVVTQIKFTKVDALTVQVEHLNANPSFSKFNISLEEITVNEIRGSKSPWLSVWKSNTTTEYITIQNQTDGIQFAGIKK